jgi:hypothetical protein
MSRLPGLGALEDLKVIVLQREVRSSRRRSRPSSGPAASLESVAAKLGVGANVTREEAAMFLGVSTKKLQRMEAAGTVTRCPGMGSVVRYAARDVLRLASASSRKGA